MAVTTFTAPSGEIAARGQPLRKDQLVAYAAAAASTAMIAQPINLYLPQIYAKELGLGLGALGVALMVTQIVEAVSQQICGLLSDRTRTRWGARKPWVAGGALLSIVAAFFLLKPPAGIGIAWFIGWKIAYDFAWAAKNVAYSAWGSELARGYNDRSRILGAATFAGQAGYTLNEMLPVIVFWAGLTATSTYSMAMMGYYFLLGAIAVPFAHVVAVLFVPTAPPRQRQAPTIAGAVEIFRTNPPFRRYLLAFFIGNLALGPSTLTFTFYDGYLKVGNWFPWIMTVFSLASLVCVPLWMRVARAMGKHRAYAIGMLIGGACPLAWLLVRPDTMSQMQIVIFAFVLVTVMGAGLATNAFAAAAILGDVADYGTWRTGNERTGSYFACYLLVTKIAIAIGGSFAYMAIAAFGYNARAGAVNTPRAISAFVIVFALVPPLLKMIGALIMYNFPLDARRHGIILRRLSARPAA